MEQSNQRQPDQAADTSHKASITRFDLTCQPNWVSDKDSTSWHRPSAVTSSTSMPPPRLRLASFQSPILGAVVPMANLSKLREFCPHLQAGQIFGSGHFSTLLAPEQVNAMIQGFERAYFRQ